MLLTKRINIGMIILYCLSTLMLGSCKSYYSALTIQSPVPAKNELPSDIQSLTLMNRSMNKQFMNHQEDTLENYFYRNNYQLAAVVLDSMAADTTLKVLADLMYASGRYDVVIPVERNLKRSVSYNMVPDSLSPQTVRQICQEYNTDALMVMEQFSTKAMTDYNAERYATEDGRYINYYASLDMKYDAFFRVYMPGRKAIELQVTDTIYWENGDDILELVFKKLPTVKQAAIHAGIQVALDIDARLSPAWKAEKRGYFILQGKDDPAKQLVNENKIAEARDFWMKMTTSDKKKIKSRAEYNLALASELDGDLEKAMEWAQQSYDTFYQHQTEVYLKKLDEKIASKTTN